MTKAGKKHVCAVGRKIKSPTDLTALEDKVNLFYRSVMVKDRKYHFQTYQSKFVRKIMAN